MNELYILLVFVLIVFVIKTKFYKTRPKGIRIKIAFFIYGLAGIVDGLVKVLTVGCYASNLEGAWYISKLHQDLCTYEIGKDRGVFNGNK